MATKAASLDDLYSDSTTSAPSRDEGVTPTETEPVGHDEPADPAPLESKTDTPTPGKDPDKAADKGEPPAKAAKKDTPPASEEDDGDIPFDVQGLKAAVKAERDKRKDWKSKAASLEAELTAERRQREAEAKELQEYREHLRKQLQPAQQQPQPSPTAQKSQRPDPYTDPEGALAYERQQTTELLQQRDEAHREAIYQNAVVISQMLMRKEHQDYDEVEAVFAEEARKDPSLAANIVKHPFPAEYAYKVGKELKLRRQIQEAGSIEAYAEQQAQRRLAELQAAAATPRATPAATPSQSRTPPAPPPQSLAGVPSVAPRSRQTYQGRTPLDDLYKQ